MIENKKYKKHVKNMSEFGVRNMFSYVFLGAESKSEVKIRRFPV